MYTGAVNPKTNEESVSAYAVIEVASTGFYIDTDLYVQVCFALRADPF